jgi:hypothetical protein
MRFPRKIPVDPMTGQADWALRAITGRFRIDELGGKNVFDVYSKSQATALVFSGDHPLYPTHEQHFAIPVLTGLRRAFVERGVVVGFSLKPKTNARIL